MGRVVMLSALALVALVGICSEPADMADMDTWYETLFASKAIGFGCAYLTYYLSVRL